MSDLVVFYSGDGGDHRSRTLEQILFWDDDKLESNHDYIQWLFPNVEVSRFNDQAPILTEQDIQTFNESEKLRINLGLSFERMLEFYGLEIVVVEGRGPVIEVSEFFPEKMNNWLTPNNHNFLRITRILKCLNLLGLRKEAILFQDFLKELYKEYKKIIGPATFQFWCRALD